MYNPATMPRMKLSGADFSRRLIRLRRERGLTQVKLAEAIDSSQRAICYYETEEKYPPAPVLAKIAKVLGVTTDELLGISAEKDRGLLLSSEEQRLWKKFKLFLELPERDKKAVVRLISSLSRSVEERLESPQPHRGGRGWAARPRRRRGDHDHDPIAGTTERPSRPLSDR